MNIQDIKAILTVKASNLNLTSTPNLPPVQPVAPAAPVVKAESAKKSTKKKAATTSAPAQPSPQPLPPVPSQPQPLIVPPAQVKSTALVQPPVPIAPTPAVPTKTKTSKAKAAASNTPDLDEIVYKVLKFKIDYDKISSRNPRNSDKFILLKGGAEHLAQIFGYRTTCEITKNIEQFNADDFNKSFIMYEAKVIVFDKDGKSIAEGVGSCNSAESRFRLQAMADRINVCLKIAKKRAFVDAILTATGTSRFFIQDLDDLAINSQENEPVQ